MVAVAEVSVSHKMDNANRLIDPANLYIYQVLRELWINN